MYKHLLLVNFFIAVIMLDACTMVKETRKTEAPESENSIYKSLELPTNYDKYDLETTGSDAPYQETAKRLSDLLHTKLEVSFDWVKHYLFGKATLTLKPYFYPTNTLTLDAKGFDIQKVALVTASGNKDLKYEYDSMKLDIQLNKTYTRTDTFTIFIQYTAKPDELDEKNEYITYQNKGLYFVKQGEDDSLDSPQQLWTQGETEAASCWFPTIDHPNERTTQEISITVPNNYLTLSNGKLISSTNLPNGTRTDYWKQTLPHAPYLFTMAIDEYVLVKDSWRGKEVNYYLDSTYAHLAHNIFGNTPEMLEFFSNRLNYPYPWDKYSQAIVYNFVAGAMENTSATLFYDDLYYYGTQEGKSDDIISHELFHHWFGDLVTCESWANLPLNESFCDLR
jgi:aminopeptidase N